MSAFALQDGAVYHTYSTYARGVEALMGTYHFLEPRVQVRRSRAARATCRGVRK